MDSVDAVVETIWGSYRCPLLITKLNLDPITVEPPFSEHPWDQSSMFAQMGFHPLGGVV